MVVTMFVLALISMFFMGRVLSRERDEFLECVKDHFTTTDVFIVKRVKSGGGYEKYEVAVDGELIKVIYIEDGSGNKRVVVDE